MRIRAAFPALVLFLIPTIASAQQALQTGQAVLSLNANAGAAPQTGTAYASSLNTITWNVSFASAPGSQSTVLQTSNDNSIWVTADTSTNVNGESRTIFTVAKFVRAVESARSGGGAITVSIVGRNSPVANTALSAASNLSVNSITLNNTGVPVVRIPNNIYMEGRNNANSAWVNMIKINTSDQLDIGATQANFANMTASNLVGSGVGGMSGFGSMQVANGSSSYFGVQGRALFTSPGDGLMNLDRNALTTVGAQFNVGTALPTLTSCGTGALTTGSTNTAGTFSTTGATACTLTFGAPNWSFAPFCVFSPITTAEAFRVSAVSVSAVTVTFTTSGNNFNYVCIGRAF